MIESRLDAGSPFAALTEAIAELRADAPAGPPGEQREEQRREAHMRQVLRTALKETAGTVAVVCGAWHAPALSGKLPPASADAALLRGMPKRKTTLTWVPWTHSRLASASGYGAGVTSPGWYHHLFTTPEQTVIRWLAKVAGVLRDHDLPVSSAHIIEAARLAESLAALRARPLAGLAEVSDATKSVMCDGDEFAAAFVTRDLVVGEQLGAVPDSAPAVPLEADLRAQARTLRLKIDALDRTLALDLRGDTDRSRSVLLHRLGMLGIGWGAVTADQVRGSGTFHETWTLRWRPELAVAVIDAARWGTTIATAATAKIIDTAASAAGLGLVTAAVEQVLLADLPEALGPVLRALDEQAAADCDVVHLMTAVPALVRAARYGDVRGTGTASLSAVVDALTARVCAGLPAAAGSLADDAAAQLRAALDGMQAALALHAQDERGRAAYDLWAAALTGLAGRRDVHGLLAGRVVRVLTDTGAMPREEAAGRFAAHLSIGIPTAGQAAWAEGFLSGGGLLLVHDRDLLAILDDWIAALPDRDFMDVLPLLRRTFGGFTAPERANIAAAVRQLADGGPGPGGRGRGARRRPGRRRAAHGRRHLAGRSSDELAEGARAAWTEERGAAATSDEACPSRRGAPPSVQGKGRRVGSEGARNERPSEEGRRRGDGAAEGTGRWARGGGPEASRKHLAAVAAAARRPGRPRSWSRRLRGRAEPVRPGRRRCARRPVRGRPGEPASAAGAARAWVPPPRRWPAGSVTSAPTSRRPWSRSCSGTRWSG